MNKKPRNLDDLKPGMLTYEDAEPVLVRKPEIIMEPVPRRGVLGRIKDRILGPVMKPHAVMVLSKDERERLKGLMKSNIVNSCAVTIDDESINEHGLYELWIATWVFTSHLISATLLQTASIVARLTAKGLALTMPTAMSVASSQRSATATDAVIATLVAGGR